MPGGFCFWHSPHNVLLPWQTLGRWTFFKELFLKHDVVYRWILCTIVKGECFWCGLVRQQQSGRKPLLVHSLLFCCLQGHHGMVWFAHNSYKSATTSSCSNWFYFFVTFLPILEVGDVVPCNTFSLHPLGCTLAYIQPQVNNLINFVNTWIKESDYLVVGGIPVWTRLVDGHSLPLSSIVHVCWFIFRSFSSRVANPFHHAPWARGLQRQPTGNPAKAWETVEGWKASKDNCYVSLCSDFKVSLDYRPSAPGPADWTGMSSVFRMSTGEDWNAYGDRIVFIHLLSPTNLELSSPVNGDSNYLGPGPIASPPVGEWWNIEVVNQLENGEYVYNVTINGVVKHSTKNSDPSEFSDVSVFAADPWYPAQPSHIRALTIQTIMVLI